MFEAIVSKIEQYDSIVIFGHINPDGDCYGSQIALRNILRNKYPQKSIYAVGSGLKKFFDIIGKMDVVPDEIIAKSLAIVLDSNDLQRLDRRLSARQDLKSLRVRIFPIANEQRTRSLAPVKCIIRFFHSSNIIALVHHPFPTNRDLPHKLP